MPLGKKSLEEMLEEIEFETFSRYDFLIPEEIPYQIIFTFATYLEELSRFLNGLGVEIANGAGFGDGFCPAHEALSNAFEHGNSEEEHYSLTVKVFSGKKGVVVRVRDSGAGFNFEKVQAMFECGEAYYKFAGSGFRTYNSKIAEISFESNGNVINLMYKHGGLTLSQHIENLSKAQMTITQPPF